MRLDAITWVRPLRRFRKGRTAVIPGPPGRLIDGLNAQLIAVSVVAAAYDVARRGRSGRR